MSRQQSGLSLSCFCDSRFLRGPAPLNPPGKGKRITAQRVTESWTNEHPCRCPCRWGSTRCGSQNGRTRRSSTSSRRETPGTSHFVDQLGQLLDLTDNRRTSPDTIPIHFHAYHTAPMDSVTSSQLPSSRKRCRHRYCSPTTTYTGPLTHNKPLPSPHTPARPQTKTASWCPLGTHTPTPPPSAAGTHQPLHTRSANL